MIKFECNREELSSIINALYVYRLQISDKMIRTKKTNLTLAKVFERVDKLYNFFVGVGAQFKDKK